jgi:hypothetical protein
MIVKKKETRRGDNEQTCRYRAGCSRQRHADVPHPFRFHFERDRRPSRPACRSPRPRLRRFHSAGCRTTKANKKRRCLPVADRSEVHSSKGLYNVCHYVNKPRPTLPPHPFTCLLCLLWRRPGPSSNERLSFIRGLDLIKVTVFGRRRQMSTAEIVSRHEAGLSRFL